MHDALIFVFLFLCFLCFFIPVLIISIRAGRKLFFTRIEKKVENIEYSLEEKNNHLFIVFFRLSFSDKTYYSGKKYLSDKNIFIKKCEDIKRTKSIGVFSRSGKNIYIDDPVYFPNSFFEIGISIIMIIPLISISYFFITSDNLVLKMIYYFYLK